MRVPALSSTAKKIIIMAVAAVLMMLTWAGYAAYTTRQDNQRLGPKDVIMIMTQRGGLCESNTVCEASYRVFNDGRFEQHKNFSPKQMEELRTIIAQTDFTAYEPNTSPQCLSFADGIDLVLSFPKKHPGKQFTVCLLQVDKDDTGLRAIVKLLDDHAGR